MPNVFNAHIFKQQQIGDREEVRIKIFGPDGEPLDLTSLGGGGGDPEPEPTGAAMIFKGIWAATEDYKKYDVVLYNNGDGMGSYIFTEDVAAGIPELLDVNGNPFTKFWDPVSPQLDLVLNASSHEGSGGMAVGKYDAFAFRVNVKGLIAFRAVDTLGGAQDLGAYIWHQKVDGTWEPLVADDDGSGSGKPLVRYNVPDTHLIPGTYAYYLSKYSAGMTDAMAYGTTRITLNVDNTAVLGSFVDFPFAKTAALGMGETVSAT